MAKNWLTISMLLLLAGCESGTLETGYTPQKLTDSPGVRQSYYADPYSPAAAQGPTAGPDASMRGPARY